MPEFYVTFARKMNKMPEFYVIFGRKIFPYFLEGGEGARALFAPPSPTPMQNTEVEVQNPTKPHANSIEKRRATNAADVIAKLQTFFLCFIYRH